jgi:hypothetical protein
LNKLTAKLDQAPREVGMIQTFWKRIKDAAPTVATILASAASLAKLLQGGSP